MTRRMNGSRLETADPLLRLGLPEGVNSIRQRPSDSRAHLTANRTAPGKDSIVPVPRRFPLTDTGNAERLVAQFGDAIRFVSEWKSWLSWDGRYWVLDRGTTVLGKTKTVIRAIKKESRANNTNNSSLQSKWAKQSESAARRSAMVKLAAAEPNIAISFERLNLDPWLLCCENGTLDLRTGQLHAPDPDNLITQMAPVSFLPEATCPTWGQFISQILPDPDLRAFVQRAVGYSLTGSCEDHALFFCFGNGANGKSTFLDVIQSILGRDYSMTALPDLLIAKGNSHPTEIADLYGKRFVVTNEQNSGSRFDEARLKLLTGGDRLRARRVHENSWEFEPSHHLWLAANCRPDIRGTDEGIWRRIMMIPFAVSIPRESRDRWLKKKLIAESSGILNWALVGLSEFRSTGLCPPDAVMVATNQYRVDMDDVAAFIESECQRAGDHRTKTAHLYSVYRQWASASGLQPIRDRDFNSRVEQAGFKRHKSSGIKYFLGIRLLQTMEMNR